MQVNGSGKPTIFSSYASMSQFMSSGKQFRSRRNLTGFGHTAALFQEDGSIAIEYQQRRLGVLRPNGDIEFCGCHNLNNAWIRRWRLLFDVYVTRIGNQLFVCRDHFSHDQFAVLETGSIVNNGILVNPMPMPEHHRYAVYMVIADGLCAPIWIANKNGYRRALEFAKKKALVGINKDQLTVTGLNTSVTTFDSGAVKYVVVYWQWYWAHKNGGSDES